MSQVTRSFERIFTWTNPERVNATALPTSKHQSDPHYPAKDASIHRDPYWYGRVDMSKPAFTGHPEKNERVDSYPTPRGTIHVVTLYRNIIWHCWIEIRPGIKSGEFLSLVASLFVSGTVLK